MPKGSSLRVQVRNHKGKAVLDFRGIPLTQVALLVHALLAQLPPDSEAPQEHLAQQPS